MERAAAGPASEPLGVFLAALGSAAPAPGGGAAAAVCGALAAGLVAMVARVTAERDPAALGEAGAIIARADEFGQRLAELVAEDMDAYRGVLEARRSAAGTDAVERALMRATEVPLILAGTCRDVLALCETVAPRARQSALSDLGVAAALGWGALESSALTVRANLGEVADEGFARASEAELARALAQGQEARRRVSETIARRMKQPRKERKPWRR